MEFSTTVARYSVPHRENGMEIATDVFNDEETVKIIISENATICILHNGSKGIAKCNPCDKYNFNTGIKIAYNRAKIKQMKEELRELAK